MVQRSAVFHAGASTYAADTCEALRAASARGDVELEALVHGSYPGRHLPPRVLREVKSVGYWDASRKQSWGLDWHRNEGIELTYLARGHLAFAVEGRAHALEGGDLTVTRPWQRHRVGDPLVGACKLYWLILDVGVRRPDQPWRWPKWLLLSAEDTQRLTTLLRHCEQPVWHADAAVEAAFERLGEVVGEHRERSPETLLALHINALLIALLDLLDGQTIELDEHLSSTLRTVELFLQELPEHAAEPWTLQSMAEHCGLARTRFGHYCQKITNLTPIRYLTRCRVERACQLLRAHPSWSVTEIASRCGFDSSQYFATVFRRHTGNAPREWRAASRRS